MRSGAGAVSASVDTAALFRTITDSALTLWLCLPAAVGSCLLPQEIGGYAWHKIADLPATRDEGNQTFLSDDGTKHKFFMVCVNQPGGKALLGRQLVLKNTDVSVLACCTVHACCVLPTD